MVFLGERHPEGYSWECVKKKKKFFLDKEFLDKEFNFLFLNILHKNPIREKAKEKDVVKYTKTSKGKEQLGKT